MFSMYVITVVTIRKFTPITEKKVMERRKFVSFVYILSIRKNVGEENEY